MHTRVDVGMWVGVRVFYPFLFPTFLPPSTQFISISCQNKSCCHVYYCQKTEVQERTKEGVKKRESGLNLTYSRLEGRHRAFETVLRDCRALID